MDTMLQNTNILAFVTKSLHHNDQISIPLAMERRRMCSWCGLDTLHGSCWWATYPCRTQCRRLANVSAGNPAGSRSSLTPCGRRQAPSPPARHPPCSDPSPSCCQRHSAQTRSCPVGKSDQTAQIELSPSCPVPDPRGSHAEHTCHLNTNQTNSACATTNWFTLQGHRNKMSPKSQAVGVKNQDHWVFSSGLGTFWTVHN